MNPATVIAAALLALLVGLGVGYLFLTEGEQAQEETNTLRAEVASLQDRIAELETGNKSLEEENAELTKSQMKLEMRVSSLDEELAEATKPVEESPALEPEVLRALAVAFGEHAEVDALLDADWEKIAGALVAMSGGIDALAAALDEGETPDQAMMIEVAKENQKLVEFALALIDQLPTHGLPGNGEFTHPIAMSNMLAEVLGRGDYPLSERQLADFAVYGEDYEEQWARMDQSYPHDTPKLQKMLDEMQMKQEFMGRVGEGLSDEQSAMIFNDATRGRTGLDLYSPGLMMAQTGRHVSVSSISDLKPELMKRAGSFLGVEQEELGQYSGIFDAWVEEVRGTMHPIKATQATSYTVDHGLAAGRAQLRALQALAASMDLSDEARKKILENAVFFVPQLLGG